ncbi:MAG: hypothetical protein ABW128_16955 [Rhizorhabdus sp.]
MTFKPGDRVVVNSNCQNLAMVGRTGLVIHLQNKTYGVMVKLDGDHAPSRFFRNISLNLENINVNIKLNVKDAINALFPKSGSSLNALAKELLVATAAATTADARKKKAKEAAIAGGLIMAEYRPGEVVSFDDAEFVVTAVTKEPTSRLDQEVLRAALSKAGLSRAKIDAAFVTATTPNKPATSYQVVQK